MLSAPVAILAAKAVVGRKVGRFMVDLVLGLLRAGLTLVAVVVVIGLVAALFMIFFNLATGIDDRITD